MTTPPYRAAGNDETRLGAVIETYGRSRLADLRSGALIGALLVIGIQAGVPSLNVPDDRSVAGFVYPLLVCAGAFFAAIALAARTFASRGLMQLELREGGFVYRTRRAHVPVLWEDVSEVFLTRRAIRRYELDRCVVITSNGRRVALTDQLRCIGKICTRIEEETTRRLLPATLGRLEAGGTATFGPFRVTQGSLAYQTEPLEWKDVGDVLIAKGLFVVGDAKHGISVMPKRDGVIAWAKVRTREIPNVAVLTALIKHFTRGRGAS
jgi:hypothetical protein